MTTPEISEANWQPLIELIPIIERTENFGEHIEPTVTEENVITYNGYWAAKVVGDFMHMVYDCGLIYDFDWMNWDWGRSMLEDRPYTPFENYDLDTLNKFVIAIVRNDRFCEGYLLSKFSDGTILQLLKSAKSWIDLESEQ